MKYKTTQLATVNWEDVKKVGPKETTFRKMVYMACLRALSFTAVDDLELLEKNSGIVLLTSEGERFPRVWREMMLIKRPVRLSPRHFTAAIHNAAAGYCAIELGLFGPQITLVEGDPDIVAKMQIDAKRTSLMFVVKADVGGLAECYIMEGDNEYSI